MSAAAQPSRPLRYADSDGMPIADNTEQFEWIVVLKDNLDAILPDFVAGDLLWYPVEGDNKTRVAPDVLVALGRPEGRRGSYRQWEEGGQPPQVVIEVLSPGNRLGEMYSKLRFYDRYGVEEYYVVDPEHQSLLVMLRQDGQLTDMPMADGFTSPRLGVRFQHEGEKLTVLGPNGQRFLSFKELTERAAADRQRADDAEARAAALEAKLRALGVDPTP